MFIEIFAGNGKGETVPDWETYLDCDEALAAMDAMLDDTLDMLDDGEPS
jgi:hypothetical protein